MSPTATADDQRALTATECRHWIQQHHEGRLGYLSGCGPRSVVVSYAVTGDEILMRVPDYNDIAQYAPGARVTLAVDRSAEDTSAIEEVSVTGTAGQGDRNDPGPGGLAPLDESWPAAVKTSVVTLPLEEMKGVRRRADLWRLDEHQDI